MIFFGGNGVELVPCGSLLTCLVHLNPDTGTALILRDNKVVVLRGSIQTGQEETSLRDPVVGKVLALTNLEAAQG